MTVRDVTRPLRWGIAATGGIATAFAQALERVEDAELVAVASRTPTRAREFANAVGAERAHGSYEALGDDPDVDIVYVASPHSRHRRDAVLFLDAGKHVLCEKPLALNASEVRSMTDAARRNRCFLMEALWSRFLPGYVELRRLLAEGVIGEPQLVEADFGFRVPDVEPTHRLFDVAQGGGALLDLGIYPLNLAFMVLGRPEAVAAVGQLGATGVDEQTAAVLRHRSSAVSVVKAAIRTSMTCTARIAGTEGFVAIPAFMHCPQHLTVTTMAGEQVLETPMEGNGLHHQVHEVQRCVRDGRSESPLMPWSESLALAATMDDIRTQIGLRYPDE
jgi:predicted dehydrogenase